MAEPAVIEPAIKVHPGERLSLRAFHSLSGNLSGIPFVKLVVERDSGIIHFIRNAQYAFHANYIAEQILGVHRSVVEAEIDSYNEKFYLDPERKWFLGILGFHKNQELGPDKGEGQFLTLETVEIDNMGGAMVCEFFDQVRSHLDSALALYFKPGNHLQESIMREIDSHRIPRVFSHELFQSATYIPLQIGKAQGRIRAFHDENEYRLALPTIHWHDIIVMHRVPDDVPRVAGLINAHRTTPLSHTNVLASGWQIPNCVQIGALKLITEQKLNGAWVEYEVSRASTEVRIERLSPEKAKELASRPRPSWSVEQITLEEPEVRNIPIVDLGELRMSDRYKYGTKAANLGEIQHVLRTGSERLLGFYRIKRPPRPHLLGHLAKFLGVQENSDIARAAWAFLRAEVWIPRGIAIPFSVQAEFLESSPRIQQAIGKLKMALELNAREIDPLCLHLQALIRATRMPEKVRSYIDSQIACHLSGVSSFVVRSSSNAEDLEHFSAAGIYESINHCTTAENIFQSIREVWGSLLSPRSVRLRHQVGISLDDSYMGVIVQEEVSAKFGGVMVTTNPLSRGDFRNVFVNVARGEVSQVVQGATLPYQYLFNTVEGGGQTISIGDAKEDLPPEEKETLQTLAFVGRLLQSHFSPDYTFNHPVDIEWLASDEGLYILQLRPYAQSGAPTRER